MIDKKYIRGLLMAGIFVLHLTLNECAGTVLVSGCEMSVTLEEEIQEVITPLVLEQENQEEGSDPVQETEEVEDKEAYINETDIKLFKEPDFSTESIEKSAKEIEDEAEFIEKSDDKKAANEDNESISTKENMNDIYSAGFELHVREDVPSVKAGQSVGYEISLENTGEVDLENLVLRSILDNGNLEGKWLEADGLTVDHENETAILNILETGESRTLVVMINTEEDCKEEIPAEFLVRAVNPFNEEEILSKSVSLVTKVTPLTVDFTVTKWADRSMALPGETILYQICIRNTGERMLHSVLTTEKFTNAGVQARFQEKEGVILNGSKTQALISEIKPGEAFGLNAWVTIPEDMESGELLNEVIVITAETGEEKFKAQASVDILRSAESSKTEEILQTENMQEIAQVPKTEDLSKTEFWAGIFGISCLIVIGIYWLQKTKRKH